MKLISLLASIIISVLLVSCLKKHDYHIQGTLLNKITGNSNDMGGESIQLLKIKTEATFNIFSNPDNISFVSEATTNNDGKFDFGVIELKEGDYRIDYIQGDGKTYYDVSTSFKDITLAKDKGIDEIISVGPSVKGISFLVDILSTTSANDTIRVKVVNEFRMKNYGDLGDLHVQNGTQLNFSPDHPIGGSTKEYMGYFFISIVKSYNGVRTTTHDTVFVKKDESLKYYTAF